MNRFSWPRVVSDLLSPPLVWAVLAFPVALRDAPTPQEALVWALTYGVLVCLLPLAYIGWMVYQGRITDMHMQVRGQRLLPFVVSLVCTTVAWWTLRFMGAPPVVPQFVLFTLLQLAIVTVITIGWQISVHAMSITGALVATWALFGWQAGLLLVPLVPLVGLARLRLKRHTLAQVLAGAALGATVSLMVFVVLV